jgi:hypothetical protein
VLHAALEFFNNFKTLDWILFGFGLGVIVFLSFLIIRLRAAG